MKKMVYVPNRILLDLRKVTKFWSFSGKQMGLEMFILTEISFPQEDKYYMFSIICKYKKDNKKLEKSFISQKKMKNEVDYNGRYRGHE